MDSATVEATPPLSNDGVKLVEEDSSLGDLDVASQVRDAMRDCSDYSILRREVPRDENDEESSEDESDEALEDSYHSETADMSRFEIETEENVEKEKEKKENRIGTVKCCLLLLSYVLMCSAIGALVTTACFSGPPQCTADNYSDGALVGESCTPPPVRPFPSGSISVHLKLFIRNGTYKLLSEKPHFIYRATRQSPLDKTIFRFHEDDDVEMIAAVRKAIEDKKVDAELARHMLMAELMETVKELDEVLKKQEELERRSEVEMEKERTEDVQQETQEMEKKNPIEKRTVYSFLWEPVLFFIWLFSPSFLSTVLNRRFPKSRVPIRFVVLTRAEQGYGILLKGAFVKELIPGSPAALHGDLRVGDEIVGVEGENAETLSPATIQKIIRDSEKSVRFWVRENKGRATVPCLQ